MGDRRNMVGAGKNIATALIAQYPGSGSAASSKPAAFHVSFMVM